MTLRDEFIRNTSKELGMAEDIVSKIESFKWKSLKKATLTGSVLEDSGMGKWVVRMNITASKLSMLEKTHAMHTRNIALLDKEHERWYPTYKTLKNLERDIEFLKNKHLDETLVNSRIKKEQNGIHTD